MGQSFVVARHKMARNGLRVPCTSASSNLMVGSTSRQSSSLPEALDNFFGYAPDKPGPSVVRITTDVGRQFIKQRLAEGIGNAAINRSLALLRRMLSIAREDGKISVVPKIHGLKEPSPRRGFIEEEKFEELLGLLPSHLRPLIAFLYYCGVRVGEALQIEWSQIDLNARLIRLEEEQRKTGEARTVPLHSRLIALLADIEPKVGLIQRREPAEGMAVSLHEVRPRQGREDHARGGLSLVSLRGPDRSRSAPECREELSQRGSAGARRNANQRSQNPGHF